MIDTKVHIMTERQALIQIESLLEQFLNRSGEPNEQLIFDAMDIASQALEASETSVQVEV